MYFLEAEEAKMEIVRGIFTQGCAPRFSLSIVHNGEKLETAHVRHNSGLVDS